MAPFGNAEIVPLSEVPDSELQEDLRWPSDGSKREPLILVVDDEPLVADSLAAILSTAGYMVIKSYGGPSALELARSAWPTLLISDVAMPQMNGVELAMTVLEHVPDCGVLLFSGHATERDLAPARKAGHSFTLLSKPVHPVDMLKHVSRSLQNAPRKKMQTPRVPQLIPNAIAESA
jgi:DNA-binding NtrC family response regulator